MGLITSKYDDSAWDNPKPTVKKKDEPKQNLGVSSTGSEKTQPTDGLGSSQANGYQWTGGVSTSGTVAPSSYGTLAPIDVEVPKNPTFNAYEKSWGSYVDMDKKVQALDQSYGKKRSNWMAENQFNVLNIAKQFDPKFTGGQQEAMKVLDKAQPWLTESDKKTYAESVRVKKQYEADAKAFKKNSTYADDLDKSIFDSFGGVLHEAYGKLSTEGYFDYTEDEQKRFGYSMSLTKKNVDGQTIPDAQAIKNRATQITKKAGLPEGGYFYDEVVRKMTSMVTDNISKPEVNKEFVRLYKEKTGETPKEAKERLSAENQAAFEEELKASSEFQSLKDKASTEVTKIQNDLKASMDEEVKLMNIDWDNQISNLQSILQQDKDVTSYQNKIQEEEINRLQGMISLGKMTYDQAVEYVNSDTFKKTINDKVDQYWRSLPRYINLMDFSMKEYQDKMNQLNSRYNSKAQRRINEVELSTERSFERLQKDMQKTFKGKDFDMKLINGTYEQAAKNVYGKNYKQVDFNERNRSYWANLSNQFATATGGALKRLGYITGNADLQAVGQDMENTYFSPISAELNSVMDLFDSRKSAKYFGQMLGAMSTTTGVSLAAGLATYATGGFTAAATVGTLASFFAETGDQVADVKLQVLERTGGDYVKANRAGDLVFNKQFKAMPYYATEFLPFTGGMFTKNFFKNMAIGAFSETFLNELPVELMQNNYAGVVEWASNDPDSIEYEDKSIFDVSGEEFSKTLLNIAPLTLMMGTAPEVASHSVSMTKKMFIESKVRSLMAKGQLSLAGLDSQTLPQEMYSIFKKKGKAFTDTTINMTYAAGQIDQKTKDSLLASVDAFEKIDATHRKLKVDDKDILLQKASVKLYTDMESVRLELDSETDPVLREALSNKLKKSEKAWIGIFSGENPDLFMVQLANNDVYFYSPSELETALSSEGFGKQVADGSVIIKAVGDENNKKYKGVFNKIEELLNTLPEPTWRQKTDADVQAVAATEQERKEQQKVDTDEMELNDAVPTIEEALSSKNTFEYENETGSLYLDGNTVMFESPTKKVEIGQADQISDKPVTELNMKPQAPLQVSIAEDNSVTVDGKKYVNNFSSPMAAVSVDKNGNYSVTLETEKGEKRTFRKGRAEAIVYQMKLKELNNATEDQIDAATKLADEALSAEVKVEQAPSEAAAPAVGEAQVTETAKGPAETEAVTPKTQEDAVQEQAAGQVPVQPEAAVGEQVAEGKPQAEPQAVAQEGKPQEVAPKVETVTVQQKPKAKWTPSETMAKLRERQKKFAATNVDQAVESINKALKSSDIKAEVINSQEEWDKVTKGQGREDNGIFISEDGSGKIYINRQKLQVGEQSVVAWHEGTHPVINIIRNTNKPLYQKMIKGLAKARKSATGNTKADIDKTLGWVEDNYAEDGQFTIEDESIVEVIARISDGLIDLNEMPKGVAQTIIDFINAMAEFFGLPQVLPDTDLKAFIETTKAISEALTTGKDIASIVGAENVKKFQFVKGEPQSRRVSAEQAFKRETVKKGKKKVIDVAKEFEKAVDDVIEPSADADEKMSRFLTDSYEDLRYFLSDFQGDIGLDWYTNKMREFREKLMDASDLAIESGDMPAENSLRDQDNMDMFMAVLALSSTGENPKSNTRAAFNIWKNFNRADMVFQKYQPGQVSLRTKVEIKTAKGEVKLDKKTGKPMYEAPSGPIVRENTRTVTIQVGNKEVTVKKSELRPAYQMEYNEVNAKGKTVVKTPKDPMRVWKETDKYFYFGTPSSKGGLLKIAKSDILMMEPEDNGITGKGWTSRGGKVATSLEKIEKLMEEHGGIKGAVEWLKSKHGIEDLRKYNAGVPDVNGKKGMNPEGERYGSFIFGEKLGSFHQNVSGVPTELTMDLWWSRTWNRYMGTLITKGGNGKIDIQELPRNDAERNIMREAAKIAADDLGLEVHELQAVLWYMEQQVYLQMGAKVESYSFVDGINEILKTYGKQEEELRSENYGVDSTESDKKRQDAVTKLNTRLAGEGVKIRKGEGGRVEVTREDGGVKGQPSKAATRGLESKTVFYDNAPKGTFVNVGLKEGTTNKIMSVNYVKSKLPSDINVLESSRVQGTEPTVSMQISRKLTDAEMNAFLNDTKQLAIPQLSDGAGRVYGSTEWGDFDGQYFVLPNGKKLSDVATIRKAQPSRAAKRESTLVDSNGKTKISKAEEYKLNDIVSDENHPIYGALYTWWNSKGGSVYGYGGRADLEGIATYNWKDKKIRINVNHSKFTEYYSDQNFIDMTMAHEIIHAIVDNYIKKDPARFNKFESELNELRSILEKQDLSILDEQTKRRIGFILRGNPEEIITYSLTDPDIARYLDTIYVEGTKGRDTKTIWDKIVEMLIGIVSKSTGNKSLLDATVETFNKYTYEFWNEQKAKPGNRLFNKPISDVSKIADRYYQGVFGKERPKYTGSRKLDKERAKRISDAFIAMKHDPTNKEVAAAYAKLAEETILQYQVMTGSGYVIEVNNNEPYANSAEMIDDLVKNKRIKIFSTESGFGENPITDKQRSDNPLLQRTEFVDVNGVPLLVNDLFRAVHDFFGHAELGNSFGPIGEENAWNVHARMFSPLARKAMTTETRGQNSFVNFSGVNEKIEGLRQQARELREQGLEQEAQAIVDQIYTEGSFAEQKVGLLPEEFYSVDETDTGDGEVFKPVVGDQRSSSAERYGSREEMFETHKLYVDLATEAIGAGVETYEEFLEGLDEVKTNLSDNAWRDAKRISQGKKPLINGPQDINKGKKKSFANKAYNGGSQEAVKDAIYEYGLDYDPVSNESAYDAATQFVDSVGIEEAEFAASQGMINGSMQAFVYSILIDRLSGEIAVETDNNRKIELISRQSALINAFDTKARDGGRFVQALSYVYKNSDFPYSYEYVVDALKEANGGAEISTELKGLMAQMTAQISELTAKIKQAEAKTQEAMEREAMAKIVDAVTNDKKTSKEKASYQKIADKIREGKINRPGMFMASTPAAVAWDAALETAATIIEQGGKLADAVVEGIMKMRQSDWYKNADEKTRRDGEKVFSDYMVESSSKENLKAPVKPTVDSEGKINIPFSFIKQLVKDGVTTIEEMTSIILDTLSIDYEGITERQVRDAITKYGQQKFPSKDEVLRTIAEMKRDGQLLSALEDVESGKLPAKSGFQREKPTDKQRELTRKIKDRMKEIPEDQEQIEKNWASAQTRIKTALENRIADLNAQIAAGEREVRNRKQVDINEENKLLKAEVARLNEVLDNIVGRPEISHETRVKSALKAIEKATEEIQDMIAKSDIGYKEKKAKLEDPRITAAREQLNAMRDTLTQMREEQGIAEAKRIEMYKKRLKEDIKEMERKLAEGDFDKKERKEMSMADDEVKRLRAEKMKLKNKIDIEKEKLRLENRTKLEKSLDIAVDILNVPRSLLASMDLSAPLRQGLITSLRNPGVAAAAFVESLRFAFSKASAERYMDALQSTPEFMVMKEAGLYISTPSAELSAREEQFLSNLAEKIPVYGSIFIAGTQRAYTGYLNKLRADVFMKFHDQLLKEGYTGAELMENLKSFAQFINEASGRGSFGKRGDAVLGNASQVLFAPRYVASRFNVLARIASLGYGMPKAARKEMLKTMGTYIGLGTIALAMAAAAGAEVEDDPRSSDFGKIKIGDLRFDIWAGTQQVVVLLSRIATMETKRTGTGEIVPFYSGGWNSQTMLSTLGDFLENKVSPPVAIFMDFERGNFKFDKKFFGMELAKSEEQFTITDALLGNLSPIWINDIAEINREQGLPSAIGAGVGSFFGVGVSYYGPKVKDKMQNDIYQYFNDNPPGDWSSQKYMKEYSNFINDSILPKYEADPDFSEDALSEAERVADMLWATNGKPSWFRDAFYASTNDRKLEIIVSNTQGMSKKEIEKTCDELYDSGVISDEFYSERIDPLLEK